MPKEVPPSDEGNLPHSEVTGCVVAINDYVPIDFLAESLQDSQFGKLSILSWHAFPLRCF